MYVALQGSTLHILHQKTMGTHDDEAGSLRSKRSRQNETVEEVLLPHVYHEFLLWEECNIDAKSRLRETGSDEEIFTSVAWIRDFNINEPIYAELCHEFYSTYEFDEVCADDELQTKKIIKFRLGGRAYRGLHSDEHFNAQGYWLSISREENFGLSRSHTSTIKSPILRVIHKMITYGLCQRINGDLDTITLRDFINSKGKLIPEDPQPGVPRVGIPRPPRATMQDLYDRIGRMEIRQEAIEKMEYRQSYHWDRYQGVFEYMARVYSVSLQGVYNLPSYAQPQYD
ncbi:hypothetical protein Tco_0228686 [Tanacetum coccineum]